MECTALARWGRSGWRSKGPVGRELKVDTTRKSPKPAALSTNATSYRLLAFDLRSDSAHFASRSHRKRIKTVRTLSKRQLQTLRTASHGEPPLQTSGKSLNAPSRLPETQLSGHKQTHNHTHTDTPHPTPHLKNTPSPATIKRPATHHGFLYPNPGSPKQAKPNSFPETDSIRCI